MGGKISINDFSYGNFKWEEGYLSTDFPMATFNGRKDIYLTVFPLELLKGGSIVFNEYFSSETFFMNKRNFGTAD